LTNKCVVGALIIAVVITPVVSVTPIIRGVFVISDGVILRVGGVTVLGAGSPGRFLLERDLLLRWGGVVIIIVAITVVVVASRPLLLRHSRGLLRRLLFFLIYILALVLLGSYWTPPLNGLTKSAGIPVIWSHRRQFQEAHVTVQLRGTALHLRTGTVVMGIDYIIVCSWCGP
jgi:hypothetical protein